MSGCCSPSRGPSESPDPVVEEVAKRPSRDLPTQWIELQGGQTKIGSNDADHPEEWPVRTVELAPYRIAPYAVTNEEFAAFIEDTGHVTEAERYGWSFVFGGFLSDDFEPTAAVADAPWWRQVYGADWAHPEGPQSSYAGRERHPVVHVARLDASAYAAWAGARLPTEAEWEHAARGGLEGQPFPWGDELEPGGVHRMNVWQGTFPHHNTEADGWAGTCPVDAYEPNGYGLFNPTGNVWEWCQEDTSRGGSYLCHASYCRRYRVSARQPQAPDDSSGNCGFRLAADLA